MLKRIARSGLDVDDRPDLLAAAVHARRRLRSCGLDRLCAGIVAVTVDIGTDFAGFRRRHAALCRLRSLNRELELLVTATEETLMYIS